MSAGTFDSKPNHTIQVRMTIMEIEESGGVNGFSLRITGFPDEIQGQIFNFDTRRSLGHVLG